MDHQALVKKVKIEGIDKEFSLRAATYVQQEVRPNRRLYLALYNTFNTKKGRYKTEKIKNIGEAPHILDSSLVEISRIQIEKFLKSKGFFNASVKSDILVEKKKAIITFTAIPGAEFTINKIDYIIPDSVVKNLYTVKSNLFNHLHIGARYDSDSLSYQREQIFLMMKKNGYFDYLRQYVRFEVDTNLYASKANLKMFLSNPKDKLAHQIYTINKSFITIKNSDNNTEGPKPDTVTIDSQFNFIDYSGKFRPKYISKYIFTKKGEIYNVDKENLTYDRLYELNVFKNLKIDYAKTSDSTNRLNPVFNILPLKKMTNRVEGEFTFNSGRNGFNIGNTYTNRNLRGGGELLEIKVNYGLLFDATAKGSFSNRIFSRDFQIGANLVLPRLILPFRIPQMGKNGIPHTTISTSYQRFDQKDAFSNRTFINSITYDWLETKYKLHAVTPINIEFRKGILDTKVKQDLLESGYLLYVKTNDRQYFNLSSQYTYTLNFIKLKTYNNFIFFRGNADLGGNTLNLLDKIFKFKSDSIFLGLPFQQYVKSEVDVRLYRSLGGEKQFIARLNPGIGIPYGNSKESGLTFEKNFFAGGSSGIRAWQARTLGPGNYNREFLGDSTLRSNLRNLDQLGEIKFEGNLEYRFKLLESFFGAKVKGATFTDFGNIWRLRKDSLNLGGEFKLNKFMQQIAIGTGLGLRFDLNFFVFRLDAGIKVKDPQFQGSEQWVIKNLFNSKGFKRDYNLTHNPDVYRFVQYNFGIGMPF